MSIERRIGKLEELVAMGKPDQFEAMSDSELHAYIGDGYRALMAESGESIEEFVESLRREAGLETTVEKLMELMEYLKCGLAAQPDTENTQ